MRLYFNGRTLTDLKKFLEEKVAQEEMKKLEDQEKFNKVAGEAHEFFQTTLDSFSDTFLGGGGTRGEKTKLMYEKCEEEAFQNHA